MIVYLVKRQHVLHTSYGDGFDKYREYTIDETIAICHTMQDALMHVDRPNYDIIITRYEVGNPDSEKLMKNIERYRHGQTK